MEIDSINDSSSRTDSSSANTLQLIHLQSPNAQPLQPLIQIASVKPSSKRSGKFESESPRPPSNFNPPDSELTVPRGHTSGVWFVFGLHPKHPGWSICRGCRKWLSYHKTTTNLKAHAQVCMQASAMNYTATGKDPAKEANLKKMRERPLKKRKEVSEFNAQDINKALVKLVSADDVPLSLVDSTNFRKFCGLLNQQYEVPARATLTQLVQKEFEQVRSAVRAMLIKAESISLTTDDVTTISQHALQAVTAHFINESWEPVSVLITTAAMPPVRRNMHDLQALVDKVFTQWYYIAPKVLSSTADAAGIVVKYCKKMEIEDVVEEVVRSYWYTLQLAVKTALEETPSIVALIDSAMVVVKYFKLITVASQALKKVQEDQKEIPEDLLLEKEINQDDPEYVCHPLKFVQDLCAKWLSTHAMVQRLLKLKRHVIAVLQELNPALELSASQWQQLADLVQVLQPCADAVKYVESERYPTISSVVPSIFMLTALLEGKSGQQPVMPDYSHLSPVVNELRKSILQEMKLPTHFDKFSRVAKFACTLDPRFKHLNFLNSFQRESLWQELRSYCESHFAEVTVASVSISSSSSSSGPTIVSSSSSEAPPQEGSSAYGLLSFDDLMAHSMATPTDLRPSVQAEIHAYRAAVAINKTENPLRWWQMHSHAYPILSRMARRFLAVPTSFAPTERAFCKIYNKNLPPMLPEKADELVFVKHNSHLA